MEHYLDMLVAHEIKHETEKAILIIFEGQSIWIPKSQCNFENGHVYSVKVTFLQNLNKPKLFDKKLYSQLVSQLSARLIQNDYDCPLMQSHFDNFGDRI